MPLNVAYKGTHIGFVARSYPENAHLFLVAITNRKIEEVFLDYAQMKSYLGRIYGSTNFWGKVKEEELNQVLEAKRKEKYAHLQIEDEEAFLRFKFLKVADERGYEIETLFDWEELAGQVEGYLFLDVEDAVIEENTVQLNDEIDYFSEERIKGEGYGIPIYARIADYPIVRTDIMGAGEGLLLGANFSDFGGRNHAHETILWIQSGNYEREISFPVHMNVKRGLPIQLYLVDGSIKTILCNETIYEF